MEPPLWKNFNILHEINRERENSAPKLVKAVSASLSIFLLPLACRVVYPQPAIS